MRLNSLVFLIPHYPPEKKLLCFLTGLVLCLTCPPPHPSSPILTHPHPSLLLVLFILFCVIIVCPLPIVPEFTEQPSQLQGYSIHTRLSKGPRGFGFNIVGGSRPREFLQVYSVTPGGPPALNTGSSSQGCIGCTAAST